MSNRRLYYDPDDGYQTEVLVPAVRASEPFGKGVELIPLPEHQSSRDRRHARRADEDGVEYYDLPVYVYREGAVSWNSPDSESVADPLVHGLLTVHRYKAGKLISDYAYEEYIEPAHAMGKEVGLTEREERVVEEIIAEYGIDGEDEI